MHEQWWLLQGRLPDTDGKVINSGGAHAWSSSQESARSTELGGQGSTHLNKTPNVYDPTDNHAGAVPASPLHAEDFTEINNLKGRIWKQKWALRNFAAGLPHCNELNGTNFFFYQGGRVLNLEDLRHSLDNLVAEGTFNPETRRPWNKQDAEARRIAVNIAKLPDFLGQLSHG